MQPNGPVYFVEVTGIMTATSSEIMKKPLKTQPERVIATVEEPVTICKSESNKHVEKTPSHQSLKGIDGSVHGLISMLFKELHNMNYR
jgi:hypothetical protein